MYLINITLNQNLVPSQRTDELFAARRASFAKNFEARNFLLLGPCQDREHAGIIIEQVANRTALDEILKEDAYYPCLAEYEVRQFKANLISEKIANYKGKQ